MVFPLVFHDRGSRHVFENPRGPTSCRFDELNGCRTAAVRPCSRSVIGTRCQREAASWPLVRILSVGNGERERERERERESLIVRRYHGFRDESIGLRCGLGPGNSLTGINFSDRSRMDRTKARGAAAEGRVGVLKSARARSKVRGRNRGV